MSETLQPNEIVIQPLQQNEITKLEPILCEHIRDSETGIVLQQEVHDVLGYMQGEEDENHHRFRKYFVAHDQSGAVLGCIGITDAAQYHLDHHQTTAKNTAELVNFFVTTTQQNRGVGRKLFEEVVNEARRQGKKHLVLDSGPRYMSAWKKYKQIFGYEGTTIPNLYGDQRDAMTWKMDL
jgi:predicted N-acetyltransferase YhbS